MKFLELVLQNFGPYAGRQIINLRTEYDSQNRPIILVGGMNGGGKTTLMDAIRLALYGQRAQCSTRGNLGYGEFLSQCVNRYTPPLEETRIELLFQHIQDSQMVEYRLVRRWTKNPKDGKDILKVLEGEFWLSELDKIWDEYIEDLLPLGISNLFLFDGEQVKELAEVDTPPPFVIEAIQSLLGLELAERLAIDLDILVSRKRKQIADTKEILSLEEIEQKLNHKKDAYEAAKQELDCLERKLNEAYNRQQIAASKFIYEGGKIAAERSQLDKKLQNLKAEAEITRQTLVEISADVLPLALIFPLLKEARSRGEEETRILQAKIVKEVLQERDRRFLDWLAKLNLPAKKIQQIKNFLEQDNQHLEEGDKDLCLNADAEALNQLAILLTHQLPNQIKLAREKLEKLQNIEEEIVATERQLAVAAPPEVYRQLEEAVEQAQNEVALCKSAYEMGKRRCEELEREINKIKKELEKYSNQNIARQNAEHIIKAAAKVKETLSIFRQKLTERKLNKLENEVAECFRYLLHKSDLVHRVVIDAKSFSISLYDFEGKPVPKHRLSAGEKQLLAIAFLWGLARVSGRNLPVAIDTPLGRLDSSHRQNIIERYFPSASHQVILLSTDTEIGKIEVDKLRKLDAIAREYLLEYNANKRQTTVKPGYFW
ncbi:MAG: DNA sulfur modification protein DndD [Oscillatoriaceae bacterium SKW80]|nr:DNA sulfur modification protein DndD [Oscillatoriaceae bacterium SKYG93]MCX8121160.1 DNA sulfur modification protein DndD [Oscillatoriaceae bacterium SKW80]MDW8453510.1 DNA sulfur modification protein DndD [Oscillatoriaceae cyanobacterium SKYGB_i_bin93]HIK26860.1 DNA sulfur modification protein DndD [Oscillatoriaceae cyanobacterium M7585_C2015_266]